ncbi:MAG TPA: TMEM175 family protein [Nitrososphaeraceae archaeon]|nr:TMEM175 family protein [Nitrososphaeraceae archaeon]
MSESGVRFSKARLERFADRVFAIVMTKLVFEITIPRISPADVSSELPKEWMSLLPALLSYEIILSF